MEEERFDYLIHWFDDIGLSCLSVVMILSCSRYISSYHLQVQKISGIHRSHSLVFTTCHIVWNVIMIKLNYCKVHCSLCSISAYFFSIHRIHLVG